MTNNKLIPPKLCGWCHEPFTPRKPEQKFCPKPARCAYDWSAQQRRGIPPTAAIEKRRLMRGQSAAAALAVTFGELTEREIAIYSIGKQHGYEDGYQTAYAPFKKMPTKSRAA